MTLAKRLERQFGPGDRSRGREYFGEGRVHLVRASELGALATVDGSRQYAVLLDWSQLSEDGLLFARCDCPRHEEGIWCKHVWATVLALDAQGITLRTGSPEIHLEFDDPEFDDFGEMDDLDEWEEEPAPRGPDWEQKLSALERFLLIRGRDGEGVKREAGKEILFEIDAGASRVQGELAVSFFERKRKRDGAWGKIRPARLRRADIASIEGSSESVLLELLFALGAREALTRGWSMWGELKVGSATIPSSLNELIVPRLAKTGRLYWRADHPEGELPPPLAWDDGPPYRLTLGLTSADAGKGTTLSASLQRGNEERSEAEVVILLRSGLVCFEDRIACLENPGDAFWASILRETGPITAPEKDTGQLIERLLNLPVRPPIELPPALAIREVRVRPTPWLRFLRPDPHDSALSAELQFDYQGTVFDAGDRRRGIFKRGSFTARDFDFERASHQLLAQLGFDSIPGSRPFWTLEAKRFPKAAARLIEEGFIVLAEGRRVRTPRASRLTLASGIDWLDLEGEIDFEGEVVSVPQILESLARGDRFITLGDGSQGMLPEEWLERAGVLQALSPERREKALRFRPFHALLLDALLESEKSFRPDESFVRLRERLRSFQGIAPAKAPPGFRGELRAYQKEGLSWLWFLAEYGFGGCLADDMGLGKTIQVLAFLEGLRARKGGAKPSLVVVPRSLVHNWIEEASRFVPDLRVCDYASSKRTKTAIDAGAVDVVLTTYGVLRRDITTLKDVEFGTVVLDEAQNIKNELSQAAKASRLLRAERRIALSGTPVENHLGELWSLFEFLNPGMLGRLVRSGERSTESETALLARAVRPFVLRRTKEQVLPELPAKNEQTILCPLEGRQRKLYEELRRHYQRSLSERIEGAGLSGSKMWVIEALLRLRQAACHPDLLERSGSADGSAKLDALLPRLDEVVSEGHKALVFSQFTTFLAIVRKLLDARGLSYEYLDGKTRDRKRRVDRFQTDPDCRLFLVSLKAGGLGLNLTAADYVFILDPWWNPAVEAQAIDRAHRIGQERPVFAYRLIAENTVEEKILDLQRSKRELADAILVQDGALIRNLTAEDLELLLS